MRIAATAILSLLVLKAAGQQNEQGLDPVTITATLKPQVASSTGRNITIIGGDVFNRLPVNSLDELLKYIPGVEVQQRGPAGSQADIVLRGGTFQQVLVLLDGVRLNDPNTGHFSSYIPIAPSEIDHIEILKGAASAIYGSEAVGGVIHIITKAFAAKRNVSKKEFLLSGTGGQYGLWSVNAGGFRQKSNTALSGGILLNNADGQQQRGTDGFYKNNTASLSLNHYFNKYWQLSLRSSYDRRYFSAQNFYTTFKSDTATEAVETFWNQASLSFRRGKNTWVTDAGYKHSFDDYAYNSGSPANKNFSGLFQLSSRCKHEFTASASLVTGLQFQNKTITSNDRGDHSLEHFAGFVILNQNISKKFFLSPAIRLDNTQGGSTELLPQLNASYKIKRVQIRVSAGKTFRHADFTERYNNYNKVLVTSGSIGDPNLAAERSLSYEAGADYFLNNVLKISSTVFRRNQNNVIDYVTTAYGNMPRKDNLIPGGTYALAENTASVNTTGFETDLQFRLHNIFGSFGLLWLDTKSSETNTSFYIASHARFMVNRSIVYITPLFSISMTWIYKHRASNMAPAINAPLSKDYFLLGTKAEVFLLKHKGGIFIEASNLLNTSYSDLLGAPMPGRWLSAGVKYHLQ